MTECSTEQANNYLYEATLSKVPIDSIQAVTITADEGDYERSRKLGYQSTPVATVNKAYGKHDEWRDLRVDKIKQYTEN